MIKVFLKARKEKSILRQHPWIFSGAIDRIDGQPQPGDTVEVYSQQGKWLAKGAYSPKSQIQVRLWQATEKQAIDYEYFHHQIKQAQKLRHQLIPATTTAFRLFNADNEGIPGLIIDHYGEWLVCQFLSQGVERHREPIIGALQTLYPQHHIYERSDSASRRKEGLPLRTGVIYGDKPPATIIVQENDYQLVVDICKGHKTGMYLDQRNSRQDLKHWVKDKDVLNCFSYSGSFGVAALLAGAKKVTQVDVSAPALVLAKQQIVQNQCDMERCEWVEQDVFKYLRAMKEQGQQFDIVILDPPKFAENKAQVDKACRGYKDINRLALSLIRPGGLLFTFSCSGNVSSMLFQKVVADAALDANRTTRIIQSYGHAFDHPVASYFPEGHYLKGLMLAVA